MISRLETTDGKQEHMSCDVGEVTESLENEHSSFSNPSVASPTSQLILQTFFRFSYVTGSSPGEPPMGCETWSLTLREEQSLRVF